MAEKGFLIWTCRIKPELQMSVKLGKAVVGLTEEDDKFEMPLYSPLFVDPDVAHNGTGRRLDSESSLRT